eukprot:5726519-Prymnesium_polylepis.2
MVICGNRFSRLPRVLVARGVAPRRVAQCCPLPLVGMYSFVVPPPLVVVRSATHSAACSSTVDTTVDTLRSLSVSVKPYSTSSACAGLRVPHTWSHTTSLGGGRT